jgi:TetR/AcrR family transcriptional regulator
VQRQAILAGAAELFAQRGYTATSMNQVAAACGTTKPGLYHYWRDKHALLAQICEDHIARLQVLVAQVQAEALPPPAHLRRLVLRFVEAYADAQQQHRVLTEDVKFLQPADRARVLAGQREVVAAFAVAVAALRPDLARAGLAKPLTMLLFGMINWMFTWLRPGGALSHADMAPLVAELFFGGLAAVTVPGPRASAVRISPPRPRKQKETTP